ncbi:MAG TPA: circadian clock KaiB family protein [Vicinamibacterales bacterium]|nr:circadian clock KaiB family protein [Vicinamibacterales bacterium]
MSRARHEPRGRRRLTLRLYVAGSARNSVAARENLRRLCAELPRDAVDLEIVDVLRHPERALEDGILVTPTLRRIAPRPAQTIVGDLSDGRSVRAMLGLPPAGGGRPRT